MKGVEGSTPLFEVLDEIFLCMEGFFTRDFGDTGRAFRDGERTKEYIDTVGLPEEGFADTVEIRKPCQ